MVETARIETHFLLPFRENLRHSRISKFDRFRGLLVRGRLPGEVGLVVLDQLLDPDRVGFGVAMTLDRVRASGGFYQNIRPHQASLDMDRGHLAHAHAHLIAAEPGSFAARHGLVADLKDRRKQQIAARPAAGLKEFGGHTIGYSNMAPNSQASGGGVGTARPHWFCDVTLGTSRPHPSRHRQHHGHKPAPGYSSAEIFARRCRLRVCDQHSQNKGSR